MPGQKHQYDIWDICDEDGRGVEDQSTCEHLTEVGEGEPLLKVAEVHQQIDDTCQEIYDIYHQQIADGRCQGSQ
jgi:hypothetical protein